MLAESHTLAVTDLPGSAFLFLETPRERTTTAPSGWRHSLPTIPPKARPEPMVRSQQCQDRRAMWWGRICLLALLAMVAAIEFSLAQVLAESIASEMLRATGIILVVWQTTAAVLLGFGWRGGRVALGSVLLVSIFAQILYLPDLLLQVPGLQAHRFLAVTIFVQLSAVAALAWWQPVRRLTTRSRRRFDFSVQPFAPYYQELVR